MTDSRAEILVDQGLRKSQQLKQTIKSLTSSNPTQQANRTRAAERMKDGKIKATTKKIDQHIKDIDETFNKPREEAVMYVLGILESRKSLMTRQRKRIEEFHRRIR